ncbi:MAG TPA: hypothetical protein VEB70_07365 [Noviherbaspirillum sp.]|nr:hypothetical protein [Noviherbaspirillum sp.]
MNLPEYVTINGTSYASAKLSTEAKAQLASVQATDAEIARLQQQMAIMQTARNTYFNALLAALKTKEKTAEEKPKKPRAPRKPKAAVAA